jgi:hypothetical protein
MNLERGPSDAEVETTLADTVQLINQWSEGQRLGNPGILQEVEARKELRSALMRLIDSDPRSRVASTIIWILGKLYDESLEPYFAHLAEVYLYDEGLAEHLFQTTIALDNLEVIDTSGMHGLSATDLPVVRRLIRDYLAKRHGDGP